MKIGPFLVHKLHQDEIQLWKTDQLSPTLRELCARVARSVAKDYIEDHREELGLNHLNLKEDLSPAQAESEGLNPKDFE